MGLAVKYDCIGYSNDSTWRGILLLAGILDRGRYCVLGTGPWVSGIHQASRLSARHSTQRKTLGVRV